MIVQGVDVVFVGGQIGVESYSYDGALGVANGWVVTLEETADAETVGQAVLDGLASSDQDYAAPESVREGVGSPVASALGLGGFDEMLQAGAHAVSVLRRGDRLKIQAATTERFSFGATKDNWKTLLDASSDAVTIGEAVLEARGYCRTEA
ncbi:hypothetical protein ACOCJ7_15090 [Knoellia sp. CPCC 206453]|uniref:hypothetical protein n=1 Tax=Knoellia pratensis TaxID=3404796 RepID=UPI0036179010